MERNYFEQGFEEGTVDYFYTRDHLGSVREVVASDGSTVASRLSYDPWGNVTEGGTAQPDFGYTGHYVDRPSNLSLAQYRSYSSLFGRWVSRDPMGLAGGLNLYGYGNNYPIGFVDPSGYGPLDFAKCLFEGKGLGACIDEEKDRFDHGPAGDGSNGDWPSIFPPVQPPGGPGIPANDNGGPKGPGIGDAAGGSSPGTGGGARDNGICNLTRKLTDMDCHGRSRTVCQYFCPQSGKSFTLPGAGGYCPSSIGFNGR